MSSIRIVSMAPGEFGVEVEEGQVQTGHRVFVPDSFLDDAGLLDVDPELLVRETLGFLLDRQPATAIGPDVSLAEVSATYPDFGDEIARRLDLV